MALAMQRKPLLTVADILPHVEDIANRKQEHFVVLTLDSGRRLISKQIVFIGTINATLVHPRETYAPAIADYAAFIIVAHNHPSGDPEPSRADITSTQQLIAAGQILGVKLIDHVIVAGDEYFSFAMNSLILPHY